jgi:hypothetical protein
MNVSRLKCTSGCVSALLLVGCSGAPAPAAKEQAAPAAAAAPDGASSGTVMLPTGYPERPFVRVQFDKLAWRPTEGNTLGVETRSSKASPRSPATT